jgi:hypothetical protein
MTIEAIRSLHAAEPFQPFVLHLVDGRAVTVQNRDFMATAPNGSNVTVYQPDDSMSIIDVSQVTSIEVRPARKSARRRKR